ncbi:hypothetical protein Desdi_1673 [Desulfitobacterium dichloroeliminans LMG P-21439]|uniref:Uncharacterized protein n=1 Tax=Desulfitobacterium dichloroeliminans (strain LMG P-21439 / DCA1) TaxID=871963 RepID=L0F7K1_DESDL|nr:hypothetical protein [Desulfitobacterium dichloroeliminans]AGA69162.1 hypothetical protein Desdi_1673 [Desulfitobacterium dichloroeliminans LMG P-21439]
MSKVDIKGIIYQQKLSNTELSNEASQIGKVMAYSEGEVKVVEKRYHARELFHEVLSGLSLDQFNKGVLELEARGIVKLERLPGTEPFQFAYVRPTFMLFFIFEKELRFDPTLDAEKVLEIIEEVNFIDGLKLEKQSGLTVTRINRAVEALENYMLVKTYQCEGTEPFTFAFAEYLKP